MIDKARKRERLDRFEEKEKREAVIKIYTMIGFFIQKYSCVKFLFGTKTVILFRKIKLNSRIVLLQKYFFSALRSLTVNLHFAFVFMFTCVD